MNRNSGAELMRRCLPLDIDWNQHGPGGAGKRVRISGYEPWKIDDGGLGAESKGKFDSAEYERQLKEGMN